MESADSASLETVLEWNTRVIGELLSANPQAGNAIGLDWINSLEVQHFGSHDPSRMSALERAAQSTRQLLEEYKADGVPPDKK